MDGRQSSVFKSHVLRTTAVFSTQAKSSDNFLSGASGLYAESMLEQYENDPNSVPEVSDDFLNFFTNALILMNDIHAGN